MKETKFFNIHKKLNAKLVDFAEYKMPVQYSSIINEHRAVRNSVGVFDVSHMGEVIVKGDKALGFIQHITVNDASKLTNGKVQYSAMCYRDGGIVDDLLVYRFDENEFMLVINGSNIEKDIGWMIENNPMNAEIVNKSDQFSLLAVQGPNSKKTLQLVCNSPLELEYYTFLKTEIAGVEVIVSRTGYTGELGFEIYFKGDESDAENIWNSIFEAGKKFDIQPVGLGARDSLRLEMGFCLYGNDIDETTNPIESGLGWITKMKKGDFIGRDAIDKVKQSGVKRKLVAMITDQKAFPRHGYDITKNGNKIGVITSGTVSPIIEKPIALGYVNIVEAEEGNQVKFLIRNKEIPATIVKLPFVKNRKNSMP